MNFSSRDIGIMVAMSLAVVSISFVFPALGLGGASAGEPPEFSIEEDRFEFTGEFPGDPGTPTSGNLEPNDRSGADIITINHNPRITIFAQSELFQEPDNESVEVGILEGGPAGGGDEEDRTTFNEEGDWAELGIFGNWTVEFELTEIDGIGTENRQWTVAWEITEEPGDEENQDDDSGGWISRIPVVGGALSSGVSAVEGAISSLTSAITWIGTLIYWFIGTATVTIINVIGMIFDVTRFMIETFAWLTNTYIGVTAAAPGFAGVFVSIPGLILGLLLAKFVMVATSLLPTT